MLLFRIKMMLSVLNTHTHIYITRNLLSYAFLYNIYIIYVKYARLPLTQLFYNTFIEFKFLAFTDKVEL